MVLNVKSSRKRIPWIVHWFSKMEITEHLYKSNLNGVVEMKLWLERVEERIGSNYGERMGIFKSLDDLL